MSPLGLLNFLVLQWFGVRLARIRYVVEGIRTYDRAHPENVGKRCELESLVAGPKSVSNVRMLADGEVPKLNRWKILRWVWPLTGWWSNYRWIARRR